MPDLKGTMFFRQSVVRGQAAGWSESFIMATAATLPDALESLKTLALARLRLCGDGVSMPYLRVSNLGVRGDSQVAVPSATVGRAGGDVADIPGSGVLCRIEGRDDLFLARRSYFLKGNPDVAQVVTAPIQADPDWGPKFLAFKELLESGDYAFMAFDRSGANPPIAVTNVSAATPPVFTLASMPYVVGQLVKVSGVTFEPARPGGRPIVLSGTFQVATVNAGANQFTLLGVSTTTAYSGGGEVRRFDKVAKIITSVVIRRYGIHRVGRPFDVAVGRFARRAQ